MSKKPTPNRLGYRPSQVAEITGIGRTTVFKLISQGVLESTKVGRSRIVLAHSVEKLLATDEAA